MPTDDALIPSDAARGPGEGRYRVNGEGSARDRVLDRPVHVRAVPADQAEALQAEARFLGRMHHAGLPCVLDFVRDSDGAAMVTAPVAGRTLLEAVVARQSGTVVPAILDPTACVLAFLTVCDAVHVAHLQGVVHGALKPEAIVLSDDGQIIVDGWNAAMQVVQRPLTLRFCAHVPVPAGLPADGLHGDLRDLGACLYFALVGEMPPRDAAGHLGSLDAATGQRIPKPLRWVIRKAMSSTAAEGYHAVGEFRDDLLHFLSGQIPSAEKPGSASVLWRGAVTHRGKLVVIALLIVGLVFAALEFDWWQVRTYTTWGAPVAVEDFRSNTWKADWSTRGRWDLQGGRLTSQSEGESALIFKQRLTPPVAIEYTGRFDTAKQGGDLSVWWCEDDALALRSTDSVDITNSWFIQAGAYANSWCTIWQTPANIRSQVNDLVLDPGRDHHFRVEIDSDRLRMWIDGAPVLEHHELFPIGSGTIALYTFDPGKSFTDVHIWQQPVPALVSPLAIGDEAFRNGRYLEASTAYGRVATSQAGRPLGMEADFFRGLALQRNGMPDLATKIWQNLPDGALRHRADTLAIDALMDRGETHQAIDRFAVLWRTCPDVHDILLQRWQVCGQRLSQLRPVHSADLDAWVALRESCFPEDQASRWLVANILFAEGRFEEIITRFPTEKRTLAKAMLSLGRNAEVAAATWATPSEHLSALLGMGDVDGALSSPDLNRAKRTTLLCKVGRAEEAARIDPYPALLYLNRVDELLAVDGAGASANSVLCAVGRLEEAAGPGVKGSPLSGMDPIALVLLGRLDEVDQLNDKADQKHKIDIRLYRLLHLLSAGRTDEARALRPLLTINPGSGYFSPWFAHGPGLAMVDETLGATGALQKALESGAQTKGMWGGKMALVCAAALDPTQDPAVSAMPWRTEAGAWLIIAQALHAEVTKDAVGALADWKRFAALPPLERMLEGNGLCLEIECFSAWRIAALGRSSTH